MKKFADKDTRIIIQGLTGAQGRRQLPHMLAMNAKVVAGTSPGKGGQFVDGIPIFNTVKEAVEATGATASVIFVPAAAAAAAIIEAVDAELELTVAVAENVPVHDMIFVREYMKGKKTRLIGCNCPGLVIPGETKLGFIPNNVLAKGHIGVVSRSGSLSYESIRQITLAGMGQSAAIGIGGDGVKGTSFLDVVKVYDEDPDTYAMVIIGEIGGNQEVEAARWLHEHGHTPAIAFIVGRAAPPGKRMGHAGAVVSGTKGSAAEKIAALEACGVRVAPIADLIADTLVEVLKENGIYEKCLRENDPDMQ